MSKIKSIQIKAAMLLIAFSLNTIVGFACAVGLDMCFNSHHQHDDEVTETEIHTHANGNQNQEETVKNLHKKTNDKDDCCNGKVTKIAKQDKAIWQSESIVSPIFFTTLIFSFFNIDVLHSNEVDSHIKYFVQSHHPPIPDICIAVQSFQI